MHLRLVLQTILVFSYLFATSQSAQLHTIRGMVVDSITNKPIGSASIRVIRLGAADTLSGKLSSRDGKFEVSVTEGSFVVQVNHIGYISFLSMPILVNDKNTSIDIGVVRLVIFENTLKEIVVQAEKSTMQLSLDKKIFNVGKDLGNAGGSASDILMNIPSVSVDAEGAVRLRGRDNVRILIDGKPSGLTSI